jgi:hypothetical protein
VAHLTERIQAEYRQFPGLKLTTRQGARLWGLETADCADVLNALVGSGDLYVDGRGQYAVRHVADARSGGAAALEAVA